MQTFNEINLKKQIMISKSLCIFLSTESFIYASSMINLFNIYFGRHVGSEMIRMAIFVKEYIRIMKKLFTAYFIFKTF